MSAATVRVQPGHEASGRLTGVQGQSRLGPEQTVRHRGRNDVESVDA